MARRHLSAVTIFVVLTLVYFGAGKLGLSLAFLHASASPVWPPAGIALAALLVLGYRTWPAIFVGAFLVNVTTTGNVGTSLAIACGNTLEAICGAWMVNRFAGGTDVFNRSQDIFKFSCAAVVSAVISPTIGVTSLAAAGFADWSNYFPVWLTWWLGDATGDLVFAPTIILWAVGRRRQWDRRKALEVASLFLLLVALGETVFGGWFSVGASNYPITFVCWPLVIWMAFRMSQRETATGIFVFSAIAIWGTLRNYGPFVMAAENQSLLILQSSTAVLTISALTLAAGMAERRRAEEALAKEKSLVETANRAKDNFLAMLSHELRTPLTPVVAALETLQRRCGQDDEARSALEMIRRNVDVESHLIDDLLDVTRISRGKLELTLVPLDAHAEISNVVEMCAGEAEARQIAIGVNLRATEHHVAGDEARFQQIIWNLLKNAIKFSPEKSQVAISSVNPSPQELTISVQDNGIGIAEDMVDRIFHPFEQGRRSPERPLGGLGLGLAISKSLVHAHGGSLHVHSEGLNRGATFSLTVPTVAPAEKTIRSPGTEPQASEGRFRILLVDDHADTCTALTKLLGGSGHQVTARHDIRSALQEAEREKFDLLISDIGLPDGTGMELMTRLRAWGAIRGIAISGFGTSADIERSLAAGFSEHLVKPLKKERLDAAIAAVMST